MIKNFEKKVGTTTPREEQETIITYDRERDEWEVFTSVPKHARKYEKYLVAKGIYPCYKKYHEKNGTLIGIQGIVENANIIISKKVTREISEERKAELAEQLQQARES